MKLIFPAASLDPGGPQPCWGILGRGSGHQSNCLPRGARGNCCRMSEDSIECSLLTTPPPNSPHLSINDGGMHETSPPPLYAFCDPFHPFSLLVFLAGWFYAFYTKTGIHFHDNIPLAFFRKWEWGGDRNYRFILEQGECISVASIFKVK